tara:strand:- start:1382 stop:1675 length:294 start_codon:yes stop_codon:yes gene_type:complete
MAINKSNIDFHTKKSVHFTLSKDTHAELRIRCFKHGLSMQEIFEEIASKIAHQSADMIEILDDLALRKKNKVIKKISESDAESIFSAIEDEIGFSDK